MGIEVLERLRFLASLPLAGTAQTEGGGIRVANNVNIPHPFIVYAKIVAKQTGPNGRNNRFSTPSDECHRD